MTSPSASAPAPTAKGSTGIPGAGCGVAVTTGTGGGAAGTGRGGGAGAVWTGADGAVTGGTPQVAHSWPNLGLYHGLKLQRFAKNILHPDTATGQRRGRRVGHGVPPAWKVPKPKKQGFRRRRSPRREPAHIALHPALDAPIGMSVIRAPSRARPTPRWRRPRPIRRIRRSWPSSPVPERGTSWPRRPPRRPSRTEGRR